jgi:hypothetical protein
MKRVPRSPKGGGLAAATPEQVRGSSNSLQCDACETRNSKFIMSIKQCIHVFTMTSAPLATLLLPFDLPPAVLCSVLCWSVSTLAVHPCAA